MDIRPITLELEPISDDEKLFKMYLKLFDSLHNQHIYMNQLTASPPQLSNLENCRKVFDDIAKKDYLLYYYISKDMDVLARKFYNLARQETKYKYLNYPSIQLLQTGFSFILTSILSSLENHILNTDYDNISNDLKGKIEGIYELSTSYKNETNDIIVKKFFNDIIELCNNLSLCEFKDINFRNFSDELVNKIYQLNKKIDDENFNKLLNNAYCLKYLLSDSINLDYFVTLSYSAQYTINLFSKSEKHPIIKAIYQRQTLLFKDIYTELECNHSTLPRFNIALQENNAEDDEVSLYKKLRFILIFWSQIQDHSTLLLKNSLDVCAFVRRYLTLLSDAYILVGNYFLDITTLLDFLNLQQTDLANILGVSKSNISKSINNAKNKKSLDLHLLYLLSASKEFIEGYSSFPNYGRFTQPSDDDNTFVTSTQYTDKICYRIRIKPTQFINFFKNYLKSRNRNEKMQNDPKTDNLIKLLNALEKKTNIASSLNDANITTLASLIAPNPSPENAPNPSPETMNSNQDSSPLQSDYINLIKKILFGNKDTITIDKTQFDAMVNLLIASSK